MLCCTQVAESESELVHRLVARKTEPLVRCRRGRIASWRLEVLWACPTGVDGGLKVLAAWSASACWLAWSLTGGGHSEGVLLPRRTSSWCGWRRHGASSGGWASLTMVSAGSSSGCMPALLGRSCAAWSSIRAAIEECFRVSQVSAAMCMPAVVVNPDGQLDATVRAIETVITAEKSRVARMVGGGGQRSSLQEEL